MRADPVTRLLEKVELDGSCWSWTARRNRDGYGEFGLYGKVFKAHRASWTLLRGPIPDGLVLDHLCRNRRCINPDHLRPVSNYENVMAPCSEAIPALHSTKTHCKNGHRYEPETTRVDGKGHRLCLVCRRQWNQEYRKGRKGRGGDQ